MLTSNDLRIIQPQHAVAGVTAVAAVSGTAVKALQGVIAYQAEELCRGAVLPRGSCSRASFQRLEHFRLLLPGDGEKTLTVHRLGGLHQANQPLAVHVLVLLIMSHELPVNEVDHSDIPRRDLDRLG